MHLNLSQIMICLTICKTKIWILHNLRLINIKLDTVIILAVDQRFIAISSHGSVTNKAYNSKKLQ